MYKSFESICYDNEIEVYSIKNNKDNKFTINLFFIDTIEEKFIQNVLSAMLLMKKYKKYNDNEYNNNDNYLKEVSYSNLAVTRKGEYQIIEFFIEGLEENREQCIKLMEQILEEPLKNPADIFNEQSIKEEVDNLRFFADSRKNNLSYYAISRFNEEMFKEENFSIGEYTDISSLDNMNDDLAYIFYKNYFINLPIKIIIAGNLDENLKEHICDKVRNCCRTNFKELKEKKYEVKNQAKNVIELVENNYNERVVLGYRTDIKIDSDKYFTMLLFNSLLGGGVYSKLFKKLRDEQCLTYEVFSLYEEFKGFLMISSSCMLGNSDLVISSIKQEIDNFCKGDFTDEEFSIASNNLITYFLNCENSQFKLIDFYLKQIISKKYMSIDSFIKKLENIKKEDIIEAANSLKLDTTYILKNK